MTDGGTAGSGNKQWPVKRPALPERVVLNRRHAQVFTEAGFVVKP
jgi:hypothetical protein